MKERVEFLIFREESKDKPEEFVRESDHGFSVRHPLCSFFEIIFFIDRIITEHAVSHKEDDSSEGFGASFGYSTGRRELAGLFEGRVEPCESGEFFRVFEPLYVFNFGDKMSGSDITDTINGRKDIDFIFFSFGDFFNKGFSDGVELILEEDERGNIELDNERGRVGRDTYGVFSEGNELFGRYGRFSTLFGVERVKEGLDFVFWSGEDVMRSWKGLEKREEEGGEGVEFGKEFRESNGEVLFELSFDFGYLLGDRFSCSCEEEEFVGFGGDEGGEFFGIFEDEFCDCDRVDFVGFRFSQGDGVGESFNKGWINESCGMVI